MAEAGGLAGFRRFQKGEEEGRAAAVLRPDQGPDSRAAWAEGPELFPGSVLLARLLLLRLEVSRLVRLVRRSANTQPTAGTGRVLCKYRGVNIQRRSEGQESVTSEPPPAPPGAWAESRLPPWQLQRQLC